MQQVCQGAIIIIIIIMVIPIHTAECERRFSLMGNIKNDWRSRLTSDTVTALMTIKLSEEDVDKYDPSNAHGVVGCG